MRRNNKLLTTLMIICTMLSVAILTIISYDRFFRKVNEKNTVEPKVVMPSDNCKKDEDSSNQMLNTKMGMLFLTSEGELYFEPKKEKIDTIKTSPLDVVKKSLGELSSYTLSSSKEFKNGEYTFEGYKLDLNNIKAMYEFDFGKGKFNDTILLVAKDGSLSEVTLEYDSNNNLVFSFTKNISKYQNVVSVVRFDSLDGTGAYVINRCGEKEVYTK